MAKTFDALIIGGGPGGFAAAVRAAKHGKKAALFEPGFLGGTCLNRGCIPTKAMLHASSLFSQIKNGAELGVFADGLRYDYARIAARKDRVVSRLRAGMAGTLKRAGVTVIPLAAKMISPTEAEAGGEIYRAPAVILASGSAPALPPIPGADLPGVLNSDGVLALESPPASLTVIGGGVIGIEIAAFFSQLGIPVTILEALPNLLTGVDPELSEIALRGLRKNGVKMQTGVNVRSIDIDREGFGVAYTVGDALPSVRVSGTVLIAAGRKPQTDGLGLEKAGVSPDRKGYIDMDETMRTNVPGIYAIGDVTGKQQLAHVASAQGITAADNIAGIPRKLNYNAVPSCIYVSPEIACVGLTERQAIERGYKVSVGRSRVSSNGRSMILGCPDGLVKLIIDSAAGEILGAHICAENASEMIGGLASAMAAEATADELAYAIYPHPSVSEMIMEAASDAIE